jgi:hypothetical protein
MLWNYAPSTVLVGVESIGRPFGARRRYLQVGGCRRGCALLRPAAARSRANRYQRAEHVSCRGARSGKRVSGEETVERLRQLQRIRDNLAAARSDFFRHGSSRSSFESQPGTATRPQHCLAHERQAAGRTAELDFLCDHPIGSRHLLGDGNHHRPADRRILEQQQRDILRASDRHELATVAAAQIVPAASLTETRLVR